MEQIRDIVIIISGVMITLMVILVCLMSYSIYIRINGILKSTKTVATKIQALATATTDELDKPLFRVSGLIQGVACGIQAISKVYKKGE